MKGTESIDEKFFIATSRKILCWL